MKAGTTETIAGFITRLAYDDLPADVADYTKLLTLDGVANIVGGTATSIAALQHDIFDEFGGNQQATILGTGARTSILSATYLNASSANMLDFDDTYKTFSHPGATAIAPAMAIGEHRHANGRDLIAAIVAGYEVAIRVAENSMPTPGRLEQVWGFATWQTLGAAAAAASLLDLDLTQTRHALGLGGFNAPVPGIRKSGLDIHERPPSWLKNNYGWASMGGTLGAVLAGRDFRGNPAILDGDHGFWVMGGSDQVDVEAMVEGLGRRYRMLDTSFKPYAACRWAHTALDRMRHLRDTGRLPSVDNIDHITVRTFREGATCLAEQHPRTLLDAQFSIPYQLALEFFGRSSAKGLNESDLRSDEILGLASRVYVVHEPAYDPEFDAGAMPSTVECHNTDGTIESSTANDPTNSDSGPADPQWVISKARFLIEPILGPTGTTTLIEGIMHLDEVDDLTSLISAVYSQREG